MDDLGHPGVHVARTGPRWSGRWRDGYLGVRLHAVRDADGCQRLRQSDGRRRQCRDSSWRTVVGGLRARHAALAARTGEVLPGEQPQEPSPAHTGRAPLPRVRHDRERFVGRRPDPLIASTPGVALACRVARPDRRRTPGWFRRRAVALASQATVGYPLADGSAVLTQATRRVWTLGCRVAGWPHGGVCARDRDHYIA